VSAGQIRAAVVVSVTGGSSNTGAPGEQWTDSLQVIRSGAVPSGRDLVLVSDVVDRALEAEEQAHPLAIFAGAPVPLATGCYSRWPF
jgi:hypothetical protein